MGEVSKCLQHGGDALDLLHAAVEILEVGEHLLIPYAQRLEVAQQVIVSADKFPAHIRFGVDVFVSRFDARSAADDVGNGCGRGDGQAVRVAHALRGDLRAECVPIDGFGERRTAQFWQLQYLAQWPHNQGFLFKSDEHSPLPAVPLTEPDYAQRLRDEMELFGFTVSGHPLDMFAGVAWDTYCPIRDLARYAGQRVTTCGLIIADRSHHQVTGDQMKFITICDYTGIIECKLFAATCRCFGLATVRFAAVEVEATVTPFDNGLGCTLDVQRVGKPRGWKSVVSSA